MQATYFDAGQMILEPSREAATFNQLQELGVRAIRLELPWGAVAPSPANPHAPSFDATNSAAYAWGMYAQVVADARARGWQVLLTVTAPAPRWATSNGRAPYVTRPDDADFEEFMTAVGREFGGGVSEFSIWNEPNHPAFLMPQWSASGAPASPRIYRGLWQAGYAGLKAAGLANPRVLFGETAPTGFDTTTNRSYRSIHPVAPLAFLREALCLNARYRPRGACGELPIAGFADHPYSKAVGPRWAPAFADDVTIGVLPRLSKALDRAAAAHAIPAKTPIYLTEYGVQSFPNRQLGVAPATQARYDAIGEQLAYENPRVAGFSQYLLRDDPLGGGAGALARGGHVGFQTGLEYANGAHKPLYEGFRLPLTVSCKRGRCALWGLVRPTRGATMVTLLARRKTRGQFHVVATATTSASGYWAMKTSRHESQWRVRWRSPQGRVYEGPPIAAA
jgi:hypothetical protein